MCVLCMCVQISTWIAGSCKMVSCVASCDFVCATLSGRYVNVNVHAQSASQFVQQRLALRLVSLCSRSVWY